MLKKTAYILIGISVLVIIIAIGFLWPAEEQVTPAVADRTTLRETTEGEYVGFVDSYGSRAWLGIPYAKPPVDELRWQAPFPPEKHKETREALQFGSACAQFKNSFGPNEEDRDGDGIVGSEDCLYLNIWSSPNAVERPVMLWIHGGGNTIGHAGSYNGARLAAEQNVVVVTINYRLGVLGWFHHPSVLQGSTSDPSGNYGTLDIIQSLKWVRKNIKEFGGDPDNVTIFGESAGGFNVLSLVASPRAKGLFHKAIVQSGRSITTTLQRAQAFRFDGGHEHSAKEISKKLLINEGEAANQQAAIDLHQSWSNDKMAYFLRNLSVTRLFGAFEANAFGMVDLPSTTQDGYVVPVFTDDERFGDSANHNQTPIMLGSNRDEPTLFMFQSPKYIETTLGVFNSIIDEHDYLREVYYRANEWKAAAVDELANHFKRSGNPNVYTYRFDWDEEPSILGFDLSKALGAAHFLEVPFVFGTFQSGQDLDAVFPNDEAQEKLSQAMMSYWAEFAEHGNPSKGGTDYLPEWSSWQTDGKTSIILDTDLDDGIHMDTTEMTLSALKEELLADDSFNRPETRCEIYATLFRLHDLFVEKEYEQMGCANIDPDELSFY